MQDVYIRKVEKKNGKLANVEFDKIADVKDPGKYRNRREPAVIGNVIGVLFDGLAYGSLLFLIAVGLSVTLGLMNFVNLAHGTFAMVGGYVCVLLMTRLGVPFLLTLPVAFVAAAVVGVVLERTLYQRLYKSSHLDQVLFSIGSCSCRSRSPRVSGAVAAADGVAAVPARPGRTFSGSTSASTGCS